MLTKNDFCDYETCVALKELGYKTPTSAYYMPKNSQLIFVINQFRGGAAMDCFYSNNSLPKECMGSDFIDAPTMWEAQKWLREEKRICVEVDCCAGGYVWELCKAYHTDWFSGGTTIYTEEDPNNPLLNESGKYDSFEVALLEGIKHAVKILKENETIHG